MKNNISALIIIDMQKGMESIPAEQRNNPQAEFNITKLLTAWRNKGAPIVHVRHLSRTLGSPFWPGQQGAEFQEKLKPFDNEHVIKKNVPDAFINTALERWLLVRDIHKLIIVGVSTNNSVEATARTAGNLGFQTNVVSDACFSFDRIDYSGNFRKAAEIHAMSLANLSGEYANIIDTAKCLSDVLEP